MQRNSAFTLIELMLVIAIIGILASLAISAYQTYTVRAQVAEAISFAESTTARIAEMYSKTSTPPIDRIDADLPADPTDSDGNYVSRVTVTNGRVEITFGNEAHPDIASGTLSLTPYVTASGTIVWRCGKAPKPTGQLLTNSDGTIRAEYQPGSIDPRYLPSSCR